MSPNVLLLLLLLIGFAAGFVVGGFQSFRMRLQLRRLFKDKREREERACRKSDRLLSVLVRAETPTPIAGSSLLPDPDVPCMDRD